MHFPAVIGRTN